MAVSATAGVLAGCAGNSSNDLDTEKIREPLPGLITAEDRATYADQNGLTVENGAVEVVVEFESRESAPDSLTSYFDDVEVSREGLLIGFVLIDSLPELSREERVVIIRPPAEAEPATEVSP